ncbi:MAG: CGGC domain-containing protein [Ignavibacteria bacterium]|jgi:predicted metal-binding protein|nr:CGGC domain-containing protein [Ignavibacteria bacterium]
MKDKVRIGIIICDRYRSCAGGKCFRAIEERAGAFSIYGDKEIEVAGYTSCGGCPGGNVENSMEELIKNRIETVHFATGMIVGYPPCPYIEQFKSLVEMKHGLKVVVGTHPIPEKYYTTHMKIHTWDSEEMAAFIKPALSDVQSRLSYD